ncbi:carboxymuconolactone decarboxylase family protein [Streptomyces bobili]|uniref:carboxymuconolactone decarboxylase family protein n=1 Tax=Streptomyces bobili TaxID=67280 RepID=UPI0033CA69C9
MVRVPYLKPDALPEALRSLGGDRILNLWLVLGHSRQTVEPMARLGAAFFGAGSALDAIDRELVILTCARCYGTEYEWAQHTVISTSVGVTDDQRAALSRDDLDATHFTEAQRALLRFVEATTRGPQVDDAVHTAAAEHYNNEQLVETLVLAGFYYLVARVCTVLDLDIDAPEGDEVLQQALALQEG